MNDQHFDADEFLENTAYLFTILMWFILNGYEAAL